AFELRRKQEEEKELRLREQVLQQRKMKLQEATNKFQRVHLPVAQPRQIVQTKAAFQLEEALEQIKIPVSTPGLCLPSRNKTNFRTTDDTSTSSASRNSSFHKKQISGVIGWDKTREESRRTNMDSCKLLFQKNLKEMQQLLEKQHLSNLENFYQEVKKADDSDSLSSLDSLEAGEQNGNCTTRSESSLSSQCDCVLYNPEKSQTRNNDLLYIPQSTSKNMHLNNCLRNVDSQYHHGINFGTRPMSSIRDSVELAKMKKKSAKNEKYNRKLRWCDQINQIIIESGKCYEKDTSEISSAQLQYVLTTNNAPKTNSSIVAQPSNLMFLKNHQENPHISKPNVNTEESNKECTSLNIFMSTGSSSAKKTWMVSKHEESKHALCGNNSKFSEGNLLKNKAKISRRITRAQSSFMPKKEKRTGSITQPQLATEANKSEKAPGLLLAPHPPSAPPPGRRRGENTGPGNDLNGRHVTLADWVLNRTGTESSESVTCHSILATAIPTPGCSAGRYEPWAKNTCSVSGVQTSACQDHSVTSTEKRPVNMENGLHLHRIPAAGKTSPSWQGTRTARAPKGSATGAVQHHVAHYSNSHITKWQPIKANVSHVITDGSSQITSFKVASRINELFSFSANGAVPVIRQKEVFDNHENNTRAFSEYRRQSVASKRWKPPHHAQLSPVQSAFDPVQNMNNTYKSDEVSDSTVRFLLAEKLASTPAAEDEILAVLENVQPARKALLLNRARCPRMSTLSVEEQKIFQSLDRLNRRLQ
ncbi:PREDICTED: uncharacterized protein KIAA1377 homolog, partial [Apaloderma vittatum]|uniref:uncharacterized protein KIAA1377 homolog n=1 Tax=Apaloderma vittatum TaxID=57397 RepID=UPI00052160E8